MNADELKKRIAVAKEKLGGDLCILCHFYQREEVVPFADHIGDSFQLARAGAGTDAKYIVFCGVHFMAEASVILARGKQRVFLPDMDAGCPLADFATIDQVEAAWDAVQGFGFSKDTIPITYMNSSAALKAFCGRHGGIVCTSSSAARAFQWAFEKADRVFFFPDENLGKNTAYEMGIASHEVVVWDPSAPRGGIDADRIGGARVIAWKGFCHVHTLFTVQHVMNARAKHQGCRIIVHPECSPEVVGLSDGAGSTAYLKEYAEKAPAGSTVVIGTEINMVARLAKAMNDKTILPLARSLCPNMFKTSLADLCFVLEGLPNVNEVFVEDGIIRDARIALDRMLAL